MLYRYATDEHGKRKKIALVYTKAEHGIRKDLIDADALGVMDRLKRHGHQAYLVGGAVRDLLVGKKPKDFDIVTDAQPNRIKKVFWNARIIGRRFRLVHIFFDRTIYEVSTFRSMAEGTVGNTYGTIDEDVRRRDFTMNALYYDPKDETILDYVGGYEDIKARKVVPLIPLKRIFMEDPVRMIRAAKYAATTGFSIGFLTKARIRKEAYLLAAVSPSRMTEEILKIISSGKSCAIFKNLEELRLLPFVVPGMKSFVEQNVTNRDAFAKELAALDAEIAKDGIMRLGRKLEYFVELSLMDAELSEHDASDSFRLACHYSRDFLKPVNPPREELEFAVRSALKKRGITVMPRERRHGERPEFPKRAGDHEAGRPRKHKDHAQRHPGAADGNDQSAKADSGID